MNRSFSILYGIPLVFFGLGTWQVSRHYTSRTRRSLKEKHDTEFQQLFMDLDVSSVSKGVVLLGPKIKPSLHKTNEFGYYLLKHFQLGSGKDCIVNIGWIPKDIALNQKRLADLNTTVANWISEKDVTHLNLLYDDSSEQKTLLMQTNPSNFSSGDPPVSIFHYKNIQDLANIYKTKQAPLCFKNSTPSDLICTVNTVPHIVPHAQYAATWYILTLITSAMLYLRK